MELAITFRILREHGACAPRYRHLARALGGVRAYGKDTPIPLLRAFEINGWEDTFWVLERYAVLPECVPAVRGLLDKYSVWVFERGHKYALDHSTAKLHELFSATAQN